MATSEQIEKHDESQQAERTDGQIRDGMKIVQILRLAQEIHRRHGGLIGYDLEDWLEAVRETTTTSPQSLAEFEQAANSQGEAAGERKACAQCAGHGN